MPPAPATLPASLTYVQHAEWAASKWKTITWSKPKNISTQSTLPNVMPTAPKGAPMSLNMLQQHTTTKAVTA